MSVDLKAGIRKILSEVMENTPVSESDLTSMAERIETMVKEGLAKLIPHSGKQTASGFSTN